MPFSQVPLLELEPKTIFHVGSRSFVLPSEYVVHPQFGQLHFQIFIVSAIWFMSSDIDRLAADFVRAAIAFPIPHVYLYYCFRVSSVQDRAFYLQLLCSSAIRYGGVFRVRGNLMASLTNEAREEEMCNQWKNWQAVVQPNLS
jgi:hypothetical protein